VTTEDADMALIKSHVSVLAEHFDSVQVFCTRHDNQNLKGTINVHYGSGDWFARYGHVSAWLKSEEKDMKLNTIDQIDQF
jgi:hypothetical protein